MLECAVLAGRKVTITQDACPSATFSAGFPTYRSALERFDCELFCEWRPGWDDPTGSLARKKTYATGTTRSPSKASQSGL